jgi:hypothetical protein
MTDQVQAAEAAAEAIEALPEEAKTPNTVFVADVDADGVFWGVKEIAADAVTDEHLVVPPDCDNRPGAYRLENKVLVPIEPKRQKTAPAEITSDRAFHALCQALQEQKVLLPALTLSWMAQYQQSVDAN